MNLFGFMRWYDSLAEPRRFFVFLGVATICYAPLLLQTVTASLFSLLLLLLLIYWRISWLYK